MTARRTANRSLGELSPMESAAIYQLMIEGRRAVDIATAFDLRLEAPAGSGLDTVPNDGLVRRVAWSYAVLNQLPVLPRFDFGAPRQRRPILEATRFGVEIEFRRPAGLPESRIVQALADAGVEAVHENYGHTTQSYWKLVYDGSSDKELVSPPLSGPEGIEEVKTVMRVLRGLGCYVGRSEGLHVHVEMAALRGNQIGSLIRNYYQNARFIDSMMPRSRRAGANSYCREMPARLVEELVEGFEAGELPRWAASRDGDRYWTLNPCSYGAYGTIEFRQHQGTLNGAKTETWIRFVLGLAALAQRGIDPGFGPAMLATLRTEGLLRNLDVQRIEARVEAGR